MNFKWLVLLLLPVIFFSNTSRALAAEAKGVAESLPILGTNVQNGSVICENPDGFSLCNLEYNPKIYGVVVLQPAIGLVSTASANLKPVVTDGITQVRVSSRNGTISVGDYITSSPVDGVGQKVTRSGYALGIAQEDWANNNPEIIGTITVSVQPKPAILTARAGANLILLIKEGIDATYLSPVMTLRYTLAALITLGSIIIGFWFFAKSAHSGIQAIGRNPLAGKSIQVGIAINVGLTIAVMAVGLIIAYLLLVL